MTAWQETWLIVPEDTVHYDLPSPSAPLRLSAAWRVVLEAVSCVHYLEFETDDEVALHRACRRHGGVPFSDDPGYYFLDEWAAQSSLEALRTHGIRRTGCSVLLPQAMIRSRPSWLWALTADNRTTLVSHGVFVLRPLELCRQRERSAHLVHWIRHWGHVESSPDSDIDIESFSSEDDPVESFASETAHEPAH